MKALTIWQPWASLIIAGAKPYEFRGWRYPPALLGERIVIHAAARKVDRDEVCALYHVLLHRNYSDDIAQAAAETCLYPNEALPILAQMLTTGLPMACSLGTAVLGELRLGTDIAEEFGVPRAKDSNRDEHANWGWRMAFVDLWPEPIPMRGKQGFWNWPDPVAAGLA